jgi:hypothetical protein
VDARRAAAAERTAGGPPHRLDGERQPIGINGDVTDAEAGEMGHEGSEAHAEELLKRDGLKPECAGNCRRSRPPASSGVSKSPEWLIGQRIGICTGAQLLFHFVAAAYERRSLAVASHWPFDQWDGFLPEHTTSAALLDRLLHHAVVVVTSGESFRLRESRTRGGAHPPTA